MFRQSADAAPCRSVDGLDGSSRRDCRYGYSFIVITLSVHFKCLTFTECNKAVFISTFTDRQRPVRSGIGLVRKRSDTLRKFRGPAQTISEKNT